MPLANVIKILVDLSMELSRASVALLFFDGVGLTFLLVWVFSISLFVVGLPFRLPVLKRRLLEKVFAAKKSAFVNV